MSNTLSHNQFIDKYLRTGQDTDGWFGIQCVDLAKLYSQEVHGIKLGSFGGTARSGWLNKSKTFDLKKWDRIVYRPWITPPKQGDIIFYDEPWLTGHVAIVHEATKLDILVIEQNWASGNGAGKWYDQINFESKRDYRKVLWWYSKKWNE